MSRVLREPRELFAEKVPQNRPHASFTKTCKVQQKTAKLVSLKHWLFLLSVSLTSFSSFCYRGVVGICHREAGAETSCHRALVARSCRNWTPHSTLNPSPEFGHPVLYLLHAHRVSQLYLRYSMLNLFAIRTHYVPSVRKSASPLGRGERMVVRKSASHKGQGEKLNCHCERSVAIALY